MNPWPPADWILPQPAVVNTKLPRIIPVVARVTNSILVDVFEVMGGPTLLRPELFINRSILSNHTLSLALSHHLKNKPLRTILFSHTLANSLTP